MTVPARCLSWARRSLMNWFGWQIVYRPSRQHLTSMLLLALIVASLLPIPLLPSFRGVAKDNSVPFPCQDRPCGCRSADQCLKKCCCFSTEQKLTWSKRNGAKEFERQVADAKNRMGNQPPQKGCCSVSQKSKSPPIAANGPTRSQQGFRTASRFQVVIGVVAQHCHGVVQTFSGQAIFVLPPAVALEATADLLCERLSLADSRNGHQSAEPPVPPPRLAVA